MAGARERRYWDSFCFLAVLNNEEPLRLDLHANSGGSKEEQR